MAIVLDGTAGITSPVLTGALTGSTGLPKAALPTGSVLQVVHATYSVGVSNSSTTYIDTGLTATITPLYSTSKILIIVNQNEILKNTSNTSIGLKLLRNSTGILNFTRYASATLDTSGVITQAGATYLDSPATTSATTYKTQFSNSSGTATATVQFGNEGNSTITLMEIAA